MNNLEIVHFTGSISFAIWTTCLYLRRNKPEIQIYWRFTWFSFYVAAVCYSALFVTWLFRDLL